MSKKILLINSDLAKNRGDRAIAEGIVTLVRQRFPDAHITGISQFPERDSGWYGIDFLKMDFQSTNPIDLLRLCLAARRHDIVLWGGGETLKDYTNKAALWYWVIKMTAVSLCTRQLYGAYQGIGPTRSPFSRRLIVYIVSRCKAFIVRDDESRQKLVEWGANADTIHTASDPAVLPKPAEIDANLLRKLKEDYDVDADFLDNFICFGPRDWFHYKPNGVIPFKYKIRLDSLLGHSVEPETEEHKRYIAQLEALTSELTNKLGLKLLFVPMHMEESDSALCRRLAAQSHDSNNVRVIDHDSLSPAEIRSLIAQAQAMVGFRLHSNIIGISAGVPSLNIYYVDKGRVFFDQIKQSQRAAPIESVLAPDFVSKTSSQLSELVQQCDSVQASIQAQTTRLRTVVTKTFEKVFPR